MLHFNFFITYIKTYYGTLNNYLKIAQIWTNIRKTLYVKILWIVVR